MNCLLLWAPPLLVIVSQWSHFTYICNIIAYSKIYLSKTHLNSQFTSLHCFQSLEKEYNIILLTLQYHLVQANMQSLQTMPVLNASRHWPILQWQTVLASLSQTSPILQFHSSSSKIPFFPKFMVFSNLLSSSNTPCNESSLQWPTCSMLYLSFFPGFKP